MLTTGRDNTLRLCDADMGQLCSVPHNNNTGRWVMPLRATLGPSDTIVCGSMKRAVRLLSFTACDLALGSQRLANCVKHKSSAQRHQRLRQHEVRGAPHKQLRRFWGSHHDMALQRASSAAPFRRIQAPLQSLTAMLA